MHLESEMLIYWLKSNMQQANVNEVTAFVQTSFTVDGIDVAFGFFLLTEDFAYIGWISKHETQ